MKDKIVAQNLQDGHEVESNAFDRVSDSVDVQVLPSEIDLANQTLLPSDIAMPVGCRHDILEEI